MKFPALFAGSNDEHDFDFVFDANRAPGDANRRDAEIALLQLDGAGVLAILEGNREFDRVRIPVDAQVAFQCRQGTGKRR